ncbi:MULTISPECIES: glycosyltransferase family 25 protein [unclassified Acinetobacter]|uniref:glycosyltransferase family 25 protein n=1 Tax=unclassified Acinetobacter TaxID=196816 RepID=UPI0015D43AEE|nr:MULTISPECIES: glycosyltransferase family 25 protein [unclassified Acinetobacter]
MKKYVISIEKENSERLVDFFKQRIFRNSSSFNKIGVVGKKLTVDEYFHLGVLGKSRPLTPGELGCTLSHLKAYQDFLDTDANLAFVFEDDAISLLSEIDFDEFYSHIEKLSLNSTFFLSLGGIQLSCAKNVYGRFIEQKIFERNILKIHPLFIENMTSTYAYVLDRKMAEILLQYHKSPKLCDQWGGVIVKYPYVNFYASYLFDHPPLIDAVTDSYLQKEREQIQLIKNKKKSYVKKYKKKVLKIFLSKYK